MEKTLYEYQAVLDSIKETISKHQKKISTLEGEIRLLETELEKACPSGWEALKNPRVWLACRKARKKLIITLDQYRLELERLKGQLVNLEARKRNLEEQIERLRGNWSYYLVVVKNSFYANWERISVIICLVLVGPIAWKVFVYYVIAPLSAKAKPIRLRHEVARSRAAMYPAKRQQVVKLEPEEKLSLRMSYVTSYNKASCNKQTLLLWSWSKPLISHVAGLVELTEISSCLEEGQLPIRLASGDPDMYIAELRLQNHPGIVIRPRHVVGLSGSIVVSVKWQLWSLHSWLTGQLRYCVFGGTGRVLIEGRGGHRRVCGESSYLCGGASRNGIRHHIGILYIQNRNLLALFEGQGPVNR